MESLLRILDHTEAEERIIRDQIRERAAAKGIELSDDHWKVIDFVRKVSAQSETTPHARDVAEKLYEEFADKGGSKYLYELFPAGPVSTAAELADIEPPLNAKNPSFGSAY